MTNTDLAKITTDLTNQLELLKKSELVPKSATEDDVRFFIHTAQRLGLDPFARQIYMRWSERAQRVQTLTTIDGFRSIAERTGELDGQDGPYWCGADGKWSDVWLHETPPVAAKVIVYRKGCTKGFTGIAKFATYAQSERGELLDSWRRMGDLMTAKCAESLALRKAFPSQLAGAYTPEEMAHVTARAITPTTKPEQPKTQPDIETLLELDPAQIEELARQIKGAKTYGEFCAHLSTLKRLVPKQKKAMRVVWREKAESVWSRPASASTEQAAA